MLETNTSNRIIIRNFGDNLFESGCDIIVNPTNSIGIMGAGLAFFFSKTYPDVCNSYNDYSLSFQSKNRSLKLMPPMLYPKGYLNNNRSILMFATKLHWKDNSEYKYIADGLTATRALLEEHGSPSIAFPALGCGHGGLDFTKVVPLVEHTFRDYSNIVELYRP
jgi:O-acetyl-ADP-ribose deacetylase (regulator of RNase III)